VLDDHAVAQVVRIDAFGQGEGPLVVDLAVLIGNGEAADRKRAVRADVALGGQRHGDGPVGGLALSGADEAVVVLVVAAGRALVAAADVDVLGVRQVRRDTLGLHAHGHPPAAVSVDADVAAVAGAVQGVEAGVEVAEEVEKAPPRAARRVDVNLGVDVGASSAVGLMPKSGGGGGQQQHAGSRGGQQHLGAALQFELHRMCSNSSWGASVRSQAMSR
jgi:hypothetical protein